MSTFFAFPGADILTIVVIVLLGLCALVGARIFAKTF
jgi:hypothetical protein